MRWITCAILLLMLSPDAAAESAQALWHQLPVQQMEEYAAEAGVDLYDLLERVYSGGTADFAEIGAALLQTARQTLHANWGQLTGLLSGAIGCAFARSFSGKKGAARALDLLCRIAAALLLLTVFQSALSDVSSVCQKLRSFQNVTAPVLAAALTLIGSPTMAAAMSPSAVIADSLCAYFTTDFGLPLLRIAALLAAFSGISSRFRLGRLFKLAISAVKWLLSCSMTAFLALMGMRTAMLGGKDGAMVQTARFAADNLLPIIGGEIADTVSGVLASAVLVKNAAGTAVCVILAAMLLSPLIRLAVLTLMLKLTSAALDMLSLPALPDMADRFAQVLEGLMAIMAAVAAMGMILAGLTVLMVSARS